MKPEFKNSEVFINDLIKYDDSLLWMWTRKQSFLWFWLLYTILCGGGALYLKIKNDHFSYFFLIVASLLPGLAGLFFTHIPGLNKLQLPYGTFPEWRHGKLKQRMLEKKLLNIESISEMILMFDRYNLRLKPSFAAFKFILSLVITGVMAPLGNFSMEIFNQNFLSLLLKIIELLIYAAGFYIILEPILKDFIEIIFYRKYRRNKKILLFLEDVKCELLGIR